MWWTVVLVVLTVVGIASWLSPEDDRRAEAYDDFSGHREDDDALDYFSDDF